MSPKIARKRETHEPKVRQKCKLQGVFACVRVEDRKNHALFTRRLLKLGEREKHTSQKCALKGVLHVYVSRIERTCPI
jgi:hypothetical protein